MPKKAHGRSISNKTQMRFMIAIMIHITNAYQILHSLFIHTLYSRGQPLGVVATASLDAYVYHYALIRIFMLSLNYLHPEIHAFEHMQHVIAVS